MIEKTKDIQREKIIEVASELFGKFGFKKTSLDDIATSLNKTKTSIYYYFKSKEAVFEAVVRKEAELLNASIMESLSMVSTPEDKIKAYIVTRMKVLNQVSLFYTAMKSELLDHLPFIDKIRVEYLNQELQLISTLLKEGNESGIFEINDINKSANTLVTVLKGLEIPLFLRKDTSDSHQLIEDFLQLIFLGLIKR